MCITEISRFKNKKEIDATVEAIDAGTINTVIGTHKLLSPDVEFDRLGLVIIDGEHRFRVCQKGALETLRAEVDILTFTATPIPRTLGMVLEGLRGFSVIATAPQKRLAIETFLRREGDDVLREAILHELKRGGQVYFLHNEVETIKNKRAKLEELIPEACVMAAHGQIHERELERVIHDSMAQHANILLCTTIIETGIDVPTTNTILTHRADKFDPARLRQLHGRIGRSHHQVYAYLLVHDVDGLTKQARHRLEAIQQMEELGAGFYLAIRDLEIHGVRKALGDKQSGEISKIDFQLYTDILNRVMKPLKTGKEPDLMAPLATMTEINLGTPTLLPQDYCGDVQERLSLHKRLANYENSETTSNIREELIGHFGKLPPQAQSLIETHRLHIIAASLGIRKTDTGVNTVTLQFISSPPIDAIKIIGLVQRNRQVRLVGQDHLRIGNIPAEFTALTQTIRHAMWQLT